MKILFLVESYYPKTSGVPVVVQYLAEGLVKRGNDVVVVTTSVKDRDSEEVYNGVHIHRFNLRKTLLKRYKGEIDRYRNFVISQHADTNIFECSECVTTDVLLPVLSRLDGKKIFHSHGFAGKLLPLFKWNVNIKYSLGNTYNWFRFKWYYGYYFKKYITMFDATICLSEIDSSREWLEKNAKKLYILQNAVDGMFLEPISSVDIYPFNKLSKPYLVSVATYSKQKNQIEILNEFFKIKTDCALVFVGPSETEYYNLLKSELVQMYNKYGKQKDVFILLRIPRKEIPNVIGNASLYLCGSKFEEYSISLIETMTKGVPFISTNVGNARILPGGITIDDISEMHTYIDRLLADKKTYYSLSAAGKAFVNENCRRDKAVEQLEKIIKEA